jgi:hypothetical protein
LLPFEIAVLVFIIIGQYFDKQFIRKDELFEKNIIGISSMIINGTCLTIANGILNASSKGRWANLSWRKNKFQEKHWMISVMQIYLGILLVVICLAIFGIILFCLHFHSNFS